MTADAKPRKAGWYWVRTKVQPQGWVIFAWSVSGGGWQLNSIAWPNDEIFEEINERPITRDPQQST